MNERLLQFIWQFQYFNRGSLCTTRGEDVQIIFQGSYNSNQGPDFTDAKIRIAQTLWVGSVELHIRTSDWHRHEHEADSNYRNVILHVVWEHDSETHGIPTLEVGTRIPMVLLSRYDELMRSSSFIPCENSIARVSGLSILAWKDRLVAERLERKGQIIRKYLEENNYHWEECFWWLLARNFGMKVNADAFESIARSIPLSILSRLNQQIHHLEALLLGQAGLLEKEFIEDYPRLLQKEYRFLQTKYNVKPIVIPVFFLRMRPGNFPSIRLAQLAMLINQSAHLFSRVKEASSSKAVRQWFDIVANDYWHYHYRFDEPSSFKEKHVGSSMIDSVIVNTIVPMLFAYGSYHSEQQVKTKASDWLCETRFEDNIITQGYRRCGIECKTAFDSQALVELKHQYCDKKRCLDCAVGMQLLGKA